MNPSLLSKLSGLHKVSRLPSASSCCLYPIGLNAEPCVGRRPGQSGPGREAGAVSCSGDRRTLGESGSRSGPRDPQHSFQAQPLTLQNTAGQLRGRRQETRRSLDLLRLSDGREYVRSCEPGRSRLQPRLFLSCRFQVAPSGTCWKV